MKKILIATQNRGKAREIRSILEDCGVSDIDFIIPEDLGIQDSPDETAEDYESNAIIKARFYGERSGIVSLADDSGLEVNALDGFPGLKSARVKAPLDTDKSRYKVLLDLMSDIKPTERAARFVCVAVAYLPENEEIISAWGEWKGTILENPEGEGGFGYDPVFYDPVRSKSAAMMSTEEKNSISHRGKAFRALWEKLEI